jgi:hypothetical protein
MSPACSRPFAALLAACVALSACSSRDSRTAMQANLDSLTAASRPHVTDTANPFRSTTTARTLGPPTGKIRVANLLEIHGQPSGPVDLYDVRRLDSTDTPIIKHLAYGRSRTTCRPARAARDRGAISISIRRIRKQVRSRGARTSTTVGSSRPISSR